MTKATEEMLALADKIEYAIKTEGEITLFETNGTRVVYVLRSLAAQSAGEPPTSREPDAWQYRFNVAGWLPWHEVDMPLDRFCKQHQFNLDNGTLEMRPLYAALSVPPGDQAREAVIEECAKTAEGTAPIAAGNVFAARRDQCAKIAAAIRALASEVKKP